MVTAKLVMKDADRNVMIEQMTEHDLLAVVEIEEESGWSPWGWDAYHKELQSPDEVIMVVARADSPGGEVAGFVVSRLIGAELHVYNVAGRPGLARRGVAARLLRAVLEWGQLKGAGLAFLEVREGNSPAPNLYRGFGFAVADRRRHSYAAPWE